MSAFETMLFSGFTFVCAVFFFGIAFFWSPLAMLIVGIILIIVSLGIPVLRRASVVFIGFGFLISALVLPEPLEFIQIAAIVALITTLGMLMFDFVEWRSPRRFPQQNVPRREK